MYGLKIADIDFQMRVLHINRQVVHKQVFTDKVKSYVESIEKAPKRDSYRSIHIPDFIMEEIMKRKERINTVDKRRSNYEDNDYLCGQRNGKARAGSCLNIALDIITKKLGMPQIMKHISSLVILSQFNPNDQISVVDFAVN